MALNTPSNAALSVSVPAKIILLGEHAIIQPGKHAVLWPIESLQVKIDVEYIPSKDGEASVLLASDDQAYRTAVAASEVESIVSDARARHAKYSSGKQIDSLSVYKKPDKYAQACAAIALSYVAAQQKHLVSMQLSVSSAVPIGGFGSSAAVAAAIIKAVIVAHDIELDQQTWFELVLSAEQLQHGTPSGADVAVVTLQKPLSICKRTDGSVEITELTMKSGVKEIIESSLVLYTDQPHDSTADTIQKALKNPEYESIVQRIEQNTAQALQAIQDGTLDSDVWHELINTNGALLEQLGVVPQKWMQVSQDLRKNGWAVKVAGAGAVSDGPCGAMVCVGNGNQSDITEHVHAKMYTIKTVKVSAGEPTNYVS